VFLYYSTHDRLNSYDATIKNGYNAFFSNRAPIVATDENQISFFFVVQSVLSSQHFMFPSNGIIKTFIITCIKTSSFYFYFLNDRVQGNEANRNEINFERWCHKYKI
jgi:hypothetical protein